MGKTDCVAWCKNTFKENPMRNEFTAIIEKDGDWYIAYCPEVSGANGQGRTIEESRESLTEAIALILEDCREDALRGPSGVRSPIDGL